MAERPIRVGFIMDQVAGHVTGYRNLRAVVDRDEEIEPVWCEVHYFREGGWIERLRRLTPGVVPNHVFGASRGWIDQRRAFAQRPFDVIMINTATAYLARRWIGTTPTLFDFDSTPVQLEMMGHYAKRSDPRPVASVKKRLMAELYRSVTLNQAWTEWARASVITDYGIDADRIVVNPPGVDLSLWKPAERRPCRTGPANLLFVGGNFERKGGHDLLSWHRSVGAEQVHLHIVSNDVIPHQPGVTVHRNVGPNSDALRELHRTADVFVLPSLAECFGIATVEAMASGKPVVVSDAGGASEIVAHGENGYIVPAGNLTELGHALTALLCDVDRCVAMGRRSREIAEQRFDLRRNAQVTIDRLKELARVPTTAT